MLKWKGFLKKMRVESTSPVTYWLPDGEKDAGGHAARIQVNDTIGQHLHLRFTGRIRCVGCGSQIKKSFRQGFCYPCSTGRPEADICQIKPELCHYFDTSDPCRDETYGQTKCFKPHILYMSLTSACKVGITRETNVPARWIDQGAVAAVPVARLPSRREVGLVEKRLSALFQDKTHWMRMLKNEHSEEDLTARSGEVVSLLHEWDVEGVLPPEERQEVRFTYPVLEYPTKVKSYNLDKTPEVQGKLMGIKGQYLILDSGVMNVRKFTGYEVEFSG